MIKSLRYLVACSVMASGSALAATLDFNDLQSNWPSENEALVTSIDYGGYTFSSPQGIFIWKDSPNYASGNGTNALLWVGNSSLTVQRKGGGAFDLSQFDIGLSWFSDGITHSTFSLNTDPLQSPASTLDLTHSFSTPKFTLAGLSSFVITPSVTNNSAYVALDNLVVSAPVPEPGTYALLAFGLAMVGGLARRRERGERMS